MDTVEAIKAARATWPIYDELGPVTRAQRELIHSLCDALEREQVVGG